MFQNLDFDWQCNSWCRHLNEFLRASRNSESIAIATIQEAEEYGKWAEEYGHLCYGMHKQVAQSGKKLLSLLQGKLLRLSLIASILNCSTSLIFKSFHNK